MLDKLKAAWLIVKSQAADIWNRSKIVLLAIGAFILAIEFQKIKSFLLVYMGKKEIEATEKKNDDLAAKEANENQQANSLILDAQSKDQQAKALVKEANDLPGQEKPVGDDWFKKEKP